MWLPGVVRLMNKTWFTGTKTSIDVIGSIAFTPDLLDVSTAEWALTR